VPVDEARKLENLLKAKHVDYEIHIYGDCGTSYPLPNENKPLKALSSFSSDI